MNTTRRNFMGMGAAALAAPVFGQNAKECKPKTRAILLHLGQNMWGEYLAPGEKREKGLQYTSDHLRTDETVWKDLTARMQKRSFNMAVIDVGEGLIFPSHPELAVKGSWSAEKLAAEVKRLKSMGIEAIPKLNFSTCHDGWLKEYGRMVSTDIYRKVVKEIIDDTCEVFGNPRYMHLGMDEENMEMQKRYPLVIIRRTELWWRDFYHYLDCLEKHGTQGMLFSGHARNTCSNVFFKRMPKSVIQNVGLYGHGHVVERIQADIDRRLKVNPPRPTAHLVRKVEAFKTMELLNKHGYKMLALTSNWVWKGEMPKPWPTGKDYPQDPKAAEWMYSFAKSNFADENFMGMMIAPWGEIKPDLHYYWQSAIDQLADAMEG